MQKNSVRYLSRVPFALLERVDETAGMLAESRAAFIREACRLRLRSLEGSRLDERYVEGYRKTPERPDVSGVGAALLARRLPKERW